MCCIKRKTERNLVQSIQARDIQLKKKKWFHPDIKSKKWKLVSQIGENVLKTKEKDGIFTNNLRMCYWAIWTRACHTKFISSNNVKELKTKDLPSRTTVQTIVDEDHFLAKRFISDEIAESKHWRLNRDGTTRGKQKIVDTSLTLSYGKIISLGFPEKQQVKFTVWQKTN